MPSTFGSAATGHRQGEPVPRWPAIALVTVVLCLAGLLSPRFVQHLISLDRRHGDMRPALYVLQVVVIGAGLYVLIRRDRVNAAFRRVFPSTRYFVMSTAVVLLCFCFGLGCLECLARILNFPFHVKWTPSETAIARFDPEVGWSYFPNHTVTQEFGDDHRKIAMYFDDLGCRVPSTGYHASHTAPSVLFVGDSFTFGHGVTYEESLVGRIASKKDFPFQVVNLGVQAYGTDQALLMLERQFGKFNTKAVVLIFTIMQLDRNETYDRRIQYPDGQFLGTKPKFALNADGTVYLQNTPVEFSHYSYSHLWAAFQVLSFRYGPSRSNRLTRGLIREMQAFTESHGARFVVVDWYDDDGFPWGLNVDVIRLETHAPDGWRSWNIPGDGHPDARAHAFAADYIGGELERILAKEHAVGTASTP